MSEEPRFHANENGLLIFDNDFTHDAMLILDGDFQSDDARIAYAAKIVEKLNRRAPDAQPEPTPDTIQMAEYAAKSAAIPGRESVLSKAREAMSRPDGAAPTVVEPVAWRTGVAGGFVTFSIGNQRFRLAYAGDDDLLPSQQAAQLEWMRTMLHAALSTLATPPRAALTNAEIMTIFRRSVKAAERDNTFPLIFARAIISADRGEKQ